MYTITKNTAYNSLEITFDSKPSEAIRSALKALRFRWHRVKKVWYGFAEESAIRAAIDGTTENPTATTKTTKGTTKGTKQDHIRIYYNGIKIDGGKLEPCGYSLDNNDNHEKSVSIYAKRYGARLPRDLLPVTNDTDIMTDYFDTDGAYITPGHPLYKYFRYCAEKARARHDKTNIAYWKKEIDGGRLARWADRYREDIAEAQKRISAFEAMEDPGQPTAEDLEAIARQRQEAEDLKRAEADAEDARRREVVNAQRVNGKALILSESLKHPIVNGAPVVSIDWSEHPAFCNEEGLKLSLSAAENILATLDAEQNQTRGTDDGAGWYYKTGFTITGIMDGEEFKYEGRYDLGDNDGGLIQHIRTHAEFYRTHNAWGHPIDNPPETTDQLRLVDYLATFTA